MPERVVVTGIGVISPLGLDTPSSWQALIQGQSGVGLITSFDPAPFETKFAAEVKGFDPLKYMDRKEARRMDRIAQFAVATTKEAMAQANLTITPDIANDVGVIISSGIGGILTLGEGFKTLFEKGPSRVSPFMIPTMIVDAVGAQVSILLGAKGPNFAIVSSCSSSADAVGEASEIIRRGDAQVMIAGGAEAVIVPIALAGFNNMGALSRRNDAPQKASRPFDKDRDGFVIGEGSTVLVLESLSFAQRRGTPILAELAGYGATSDAFHITQPADRGEGAVRAMRIALRKAGLQASDVQYINAHGTSTPLNDKFETAAIKDVFGEHAHKVPVSSTKSMSGHLMGSAGAFEAAVCVLTMQHGIIPPTINLENPDPECDLDYVPNVARRAPAHIAMSNSLGFGGHNSSLILRRWEGT
ncbi:MAG: beta-ketoacyl-ACP synthase II [Chloroflexi bacterium]|nr:beta-ketoacyl-ACP synthase II [Chloroflexota bacterium]